MALDVWYPVYPDPSDVLNYLFDGRSIRAVDNSNHSYFDDPVYNRKLAAAARLTGPRRYAAYQALETDLLRNAAPSAPLFNSARSRLLLRPRRLSGLPAHLPNRPRRAVPQEFSLTRQISMRPRPGPIAITASRGWRATPACIGRTVVSVAGDRETPVDKPSATSCGAGFAGRASA